MDRQTNSDDLTAHEQPEPVPPAHSPKRTSRRRLLRRSKQDRVIGGVCGGLGRYLDSEPMLFRVVFLVLFIAGGFGLLLYIIAWISMPEFKTEEEERHDSLASPLSSRMAGSVIGGLLILVGVIILLERFIDWFDPRIIGGIILIAIGVLIVIRGMQREAVG